MYTWLIHVDVWQKATQYCKAIILQHKLSFLKSKYTENTLLKSKINALLPMTQSCIDCEDIMSAFRPTEPGWG